MLDFGSHSMPDDELRRYLTEPYRFSPASVSYAAVATLRRDGSPFVVPMGYWYDGTYLYLTTTPGRGLASRLRVDPRVCVTIFNWSFPTSFVILVGTATQVPDPTNEIVLRIHRRYPKEHVADEAAFDAVWLAPGRLLFRMAITDKVGVDGNKATDLVAEAVLPFERN